MMGCPGRKGSQKFLKTFKDNFFSDPDSREVGFQSR